MTRKHEALTLGACIILALLLITGAAFGASLCPGEDATIDFTWVASPDTGVYDVEPNVDGAWQPPIRVTGEAYTANVLASIDYFQVRVWAVTVDADCGDVRAETASESEVFIRLTRPTQAGAVSAVIR